MLRAGLCSSFRVFCFAIDDGFGEPEQLVEERRGAFLIGRIVWRTIFFEAVAHARTREVFWNRKCPHPDGAQPQSRETSEPAEAAGRNRDDAEGFSFVFRQ